MDPKCFRQMAKSVQSPCKVKVLSLRKSEKAVWLVSSELEKKVVGNKVEEENRF